MRSKEYTINIRPIAWKRPGKNQSHYYDTQTAEKLAYGLSISRIHGNEPKFEGPLCVEMVFYFPIPKLSRNRQATQYHWTVPDKDNIIKHIFDSISQTGIVWHDDRQVAKGSWEALYSKEPRVYLKISELE